ncbi:MAG: hypothetical protein U1E50_14975 [Caulobacteraceae bacterium]
MRRTLIALGTFAVLAGPPAVEAYPSREEAGRIASAFYRAHPNAPPLSGPQSRNGQVRRPATTRPLATPSQPAPSPPASPTPAFAPAPAPSAAVRPVFKVGNDGAVFNRPSRPTVFMLTQPTLIVKLTDYHWNGGRGAPAGRIALRDEAGRTWGPWQAVLINGVYWEIRPNIVLPAGRYTVIDSDPATWAQNAATGGAGMSWADGVPQAQTSAPLPPPAAIREIFKVGNDGGVMNGPSRATTFYLGQPTLIVKLTDYHWNGGRGAPAGRIALRDEAGRTWGPWQAVLINGVYWEIRPNIVLPAGRYTVIDSDPATWAQNAGTGGAGMSWAEGAPR